MTYKQLLSLADMQANVFEANVDTLLFQVSTAIDCLSVDFSGKLLFTSNNLGIHDSSKVNTPT